MKDLRFKIDIFGGSLIAISSILFLIGLGPFATFLTLVIYFVHDYRRIEA